LLIKRLLLERPFVSLQSLNAVGEDLPLSATFFSNHSQDRDYGTRHDGT